MAGTEAQATASLQLMLSGISEVLAGLDKLEAKLLAIKGLSGSVSLGGSGSSGGANGNVSGIGTSSVASGGGRGGALFGDTAGPAAQSTQWNPPSAQADMNVLGLSTAGNSAGMMSAIHAQNSAINYASKPFYASMEGQMYGTNRLALPGSGDSSFSFMNTVGYEYPQISPMFGGSSGFGTRGGMPTGGPVAPPTMFNSYMNSYGSSLPYEPLALPGMGGSSFAAMNTIMAPPPMVSQGYGSPIGPGLSGSPGPTNPLDPLAQWKFGQYMNGGLGSTPFQSQNPNQDEGMSMMSLIGLHFALRQFESASAVSGGIWAGTNAGGKPFYSENFLPSNIQMGLTLGGTVAGALIPGVGPAVGAAAGAYIGQGFTQLQPYIDRDIQQQQVSQYYSMGGLGTAPQMPANQLGFMQEQLTRGMPLPASWTNMQTHITPMPSSVQELILGGSTAIGALTGILTGGIVSGIATPAVGLGAGVSAGFGAAAATTALANAGWAWSHHEEGLFSDKATDAQKQAFMNLAQNPYIQQKYGYYGKKQLTPNYISDVIEAGAYIDPVAAQNALEGLDPNNMPMSNKLRAAGNIAGSVIRENIDLDARSGVIDPFIDIAHRKAQLGGFEGLGEYYGGNGIAGKKRQILLDSMSVNSGNPGAVASLQAQIDTIDFSGGQEMEHALFGIMNSSLETRQATALGTAQYSSMVGSAASSGQFDEAKAKALRETVALKERELEITKYMEPVAKQNLQTEIEKMTAQARILDYTGKIANAQGVYSIATTGNIETSSAASIALLSGVGGSQAGAALSSIYNARALDVKAAKSLLAAFPDKNSAEALSARRQLAAAQVEEMQAREAQASVPYNGFVQAERYQLAGSMSAIEAGLTPAGPGDIRRNLSQQMSITRSHIADIDRAAAKLTQAEGGQLDPAQAQEFARQRSQSVSELSGLAKEFNYGYMDRLISAAYNMPQESAWYVRSQASNREASQYGVVHPSIGGTKDQIQQMAALGYDLRSVASAPGSGSPGGFNQQAIGSATGSVRLPVLQIPIQITDAKSGNVLAHNEVTFENGKSVTDFRSRTPLASRPAA